MKKFANLDYVIDMFKLLSENPYSALWEIADDFEINGHIVSIKKSSQFNHVIVDGRYVTISGYVQENGISYTGTAYIRNILSK